MSIEVTFVDAVLLIWGCVATVLAGHYKWQSDAAKMFITAFMRDADLREKLVSEYSKHYSGREA